MFFTAVTPILENSLKLFLVCCNDVLISSAFANAVLFASRVAVTKLSTILVNVLPYTSALDGENTAGKAEVLFTTFSTYGVHID